MEMEKSKKKKKAKSVSFGDGLIFIPRKKSRRRND